MEEYISRAKTLKEIKGSVSEVFNIASNAGRMYQKITEIVESVPAADVAPVVHAKDISPCEKGKWFCCSNCGFGFDDYYSHDERMMRNNELNYCPNCGAKMD